MSLLGRLKGALARGILEAITDSGYEITLLSGEKMTLNEHLQEFGMASKSPSGAYVLAGFIGADRNNCSVVTVEHPDYKPTDLAEGETCVYNAHDIQLYFREGGIIRATGSGLTDFIIDGNLTVNGDIDATGEITADSASAGVTVTGHKHPINSGSSAPGPTASPTPGT